MENNPDSVLAELRSIAAEIVPCKREENWSIGEIEAREKLHRMSVLLDQLDKWLSQGGSRPAAWASRGVNLELPDTAQAIYAEIDKLRDVLTGHKGQLILQSRNSELIVATTNLGVNGGKDTVVAALASHAARSHDPAEAVRMLRAQLIETLSKTGVA